MEAAAEEAGTRKVGTELLDDAAKLAPFNPTSPAAIQIALRLANVLATDVVFDIGCGDGRFVIAAAEGGATTCVGVEYDAELVDRARKSVFEKNLEGKVTILHEDACQVDISSGIFGSYLAWILLTHILATVIFVYLVPKGLALMQEQLHLAFERGCRIVSYIFSIPGKEPCAVETCKGVKVSLYKKWTIVLRWLFPGDQLTARNVYDIECMWVMIRK